MFQNIAPLLKSIKVSVNLSQRDNGEYVAIVIPRPRFKTSNAALNNMPPLTRVSASIEELERELSSERMASNIRSYHHEVVNDEAFLKALSKKAGHENDGGTEAPASDAPAKRGRKSNAEKAAAAATTTTGEPKAPEAPKVSKEERLILNELDKLDKLINEANREGAKTKYKSIVSVYNQAISEEGGSVVISQETLERITKTRERIKIMPEQAKMSLDMDLD
jgi:hypothetical protein